MGGDWARAICVHWHNKVLLTFVDHQTIQDDTLCRFRSRGLPKQNLYQETNDPIHFPWTNGNFSRTENYWNDTFQQRFSGYGRQWYAMWSWRWVCQVDESCQSKKQSHWKAFIVTSEKPTASGGSAASPPPPSPPLSPRETSDDENAGGGENPNAGAKVTAAKPIEPQAMNAMGAKVTLPQHIEEELMDVVPPDEGIVGIIERDTLPTLHPVSDVVADGQTSSRLRRSKRAKAEKQSTRMVNTAKMGNLPVSRGRKKPKQW
jgi:hypothetical protein